MMRAYQTNNSAQLFQLVKDKIDDDAKILGISDVVEKLEQGQLFIVKQGQQFNPLSKIDAILQAKPSAMMCQQDNDLLNDITIQKIKKSGVVLVLVNCVAVSTVFALQQFYYNNLQQLTIVGVTGTDGKSSVAMMFAMMRPETTGVIGTLGYGKVNELTFTGMTTPTIVALYAMLASLQQQGCTTVIMEVSSHAIHQQRIAGLTFDVFAITNLGRDHLDYHGTIENYHHCKLSFLASNQVKKAIINADDKNIQYQAAKTTPVSISNLTALNIKTVKYSANGLIISFINKAKTDQGVGQQNAPALLGTYIPVGNGLALNLYGQFNVYNLLSVMAMYQQLGESDKNIAHMLQNLQAVEGRMQKIADPAGRHVFVDFAHTANGLKNALQAVRQHFKSKIILVFGCGGDRDKGKRPEMARFAEQLADQVIITNDNPRGENPSDIVADMKAGLKQPSAVMVIEDRYQAIKYALSVCKKDEVLLVAGKGHETTQTDKSGTKAFHDATVIQKIMRGEA